MVETFQNTLQYVCVSALAAIAVFAALSFAAEIGRKAMRRLRSVTLAVWLCIAAASSVILGSDKTNGVLQAILPFGPQIQLVQLPQVPPVVPPSAPPLAAPSPRASADMPFRARAWNRRGAWNDSFRCAFPGEWVFPYGTGHLDRVEVCSQGRILPRYGSTNVIADIGVPLQIVNPLTSFGCGTTERNSYVFAWTNAIIGRVSREAVADAETIDASIELFRNGDIAITTNGVTELRPRELPFPRDGYGQDDEWVTANFTNATEILAQGYTNWVCTATESETNGYFSLSVRIGDDPPETIQLKVGNYSVAVTNAGEYVFLLEKGVRHPIKLSYFLDDVEYAPIGGVHVPAEPSRGAIGSPGYSLKFVATGDDGDGLELEEPLADRDGHVLCWPWLSIAPAELTDPVFPVMFHADVFGIPVEATPNVTWVSGGQVIETWENLTLTGDEDVGDIAVTATYRDIVLHGSIRVIRHVASSGIALEGGGLVVVEDAYTNSPGNVVSGGSTSAGLRLAWALSEAGTLRLSSDCAGVTVTNADGTAVSLPHSWSAEADDEGEMSLSAFFPDPAAQAGGVGSFAFTFEPQGGGAALSNSVQVQVVKVRVEALADWPSNKVRHVFGPKEGFNIVQTPQTPVLSYSVDEGSPAYAGIDGCMAPNEPGQFDIRFSSGGCAGSLTFECIAPTCLRGGNPRALATEEWELLDKSSLQNGELGVIMHIDTWLEPQYVSFANVRLYEGECNPTNRTGCFLDQNLFPDSLLAHDVAAGASADPSSDYAAIQGEGNRTQSGDNAGSLLYDTSNLSSGSYQLYIPLRWYVHNGSATNALPDNVQTVWAFTNGTMRVSKNGVTWERSSDGTEHQVEE